MKWVGLTGGIASGKTTVAQILRDLGRPVIDADQLAREVVVVGSRGLSDVVKGFGRGILQKNGELDRKALGRIIFADRAKRDELEKILHPLIEQKRAEQRRALERDQCELAFYDVPLLFEKNMQAEFDATVLVYAPVAQQISRLRERDGLSEAAIEERIKSQLPIDEKLPLATYVLRNESSLVELRRQVKDLVAKL